MYEKKIAKIEFPMAAAAAVVVVVVGTVAMKAKLRQKHD